MAGIQKEIAMRLAWIVTVLLCRQLRERWPLMTRARHRREVAGLREVIEELREGWRL